MKSEHGEQVTADETAIVESESGVDSRLAVSSTGEQIAQLILEGFVEPTVDKGVVAGRARG